MITAMEVKINHTTKILNPIISRLILWSIALFVFYMLYFLMYPEDSSWKSYFSGSASRTITNVVYVFLFCAVISEVSLFIDNTLNKLLPWQNRPRTRLFLQGFIQILANASFVTGTFFLFDIISDNAIQENSIKLWQCLVTNFVISITISGINTGNFLLVNWKQAATEAARQRLRASELRQAAMTAELEALKLQIDPHFIFNNLSVLSELILEDQQKGYEYAENFAKVYRFLLSNSTKDVITLKEELKFLESYICLIYNRIGKGVCFKVNIAETYYEFNIPPMTLQLLVENAIKHNKTLKKSPLLIKIEAFPPRQLIVSNTRCPLMRDHVSPGVGLSNIQKRYALLSEQQPVIEQTDKLFIVKIPLLK